MSDLTQSVSAAFLFEVKAGLGFAFHERQKASRRMAAFKDSFDHFIRGNEDIDRHPLLGVTKILRRLKRPTSL
jgi:hypothetical protein